MILRKTLLLALLVVGPAPAQPSKDWKETLPRLEAVTQQMFDHSGVPGMAIGIVSHGQVVYLKGFGVRQAGKPEAVDPETVFQLASCSKPMTSTALAILVGQKKIHWDDRIRKHFPDFRLQDPWVSEHLTFRDLLSHHSGLPEFAGDVLEDLGFDRATILQRLRLLDSAYDFRAGYAYTNFGYTAAGETAARALHQPYEEMMQQQLFKPLGMSSASARFDDYAARPNRASSHSLENGKAVVTVRNPQAQAPAGGVSCSTRDFLRWAQFHLDQSKTLVPEQVLAETYRIHSVTGRNPANFSASGYYALGWGVSYDSHGRLRLSHSGAFFKGVRSCVTLLPQEELGIVVVANAFPTALPEAISMAALKLYDEGQVELADVQGVEKKVLASLIEMSAAKVPAADSGPPSRPLPAYTGTYGNAFFGPARVDLRDGQLRLHLGKKEFALRPLSSQNFAADARRTEFEDITPFTVHFEPSKGFQLGGLGPAQFSWFRHRP